MPENETYTYWGAIEGELIELPGGQNQFAIKSSLQSGAIFCFVENYSMTQSLSGNVGERVYVYGLIREAKAGDKKTVDVKEFRPFSKTEMSLDEILAILGE